MSIPDADDARNAKGAHEEHGHGHLPEPVEPTHPAIWAAGLIAISLLLIWGFAHFFRVGEAVGRDHGLLPAKAVVEVVDHEKLIADRSDTVLLKGQELYAKNCAQCHGGDGVPPSSASGNPRNFVKDAFSAPDGGGPYGFYLTLTKGYNAMPAFRQLTPEERYQVTHFVRERMVKPRNAAHYLDEDVDTVRARMPKAGEAGQATIAPTAVQPPFIVRQMQAVMSGEGERRLLGTAAWLDRASAQALLARADGATVAALADLVRAAEDRPHVVARVLEQTRGDVAAFALVLTGSQGSAASATTGGAFALLPASTVESLHRLLASVASTDPAPPAPDPSVAPVPDVH